MSLESQPDSPDSRDSDLTKPALEPASGNPGGSGRELGPLPKAVRLFLYFLGWLLLLVGLLGLALPGIQGILTIILGAALLSLASEATHRRLRSVLRRWPAADRQMERFRRRLHQLLSRRKKNPPSGQPGA